MISEQPTASSQASSLQHALFRLAEALQQQLSTNVSAVSPGPRLFRPQPLQADEVVRETQLYQQRIQEQWEREARVVAKTHLMTFAPSGFMRSASVPGLKIPSARRNLRNLFC